MTKPNRNERTNSNIRSVVSYASVADFRDAFLSNTNHLYSLAYLLTGDHEMAERCFVMGFEQCIDGNSVFKGWVQSWARRAIIKNAILMTSSAEGAGERCNRDYQQVICRREKDNLLQNVVQLEPFERCVFVMSMLERLSDYECSLLLSCTRGEVALGRRSAIEHLTLVFV
jgi:DNA-directed RNA polymerase specialized sigma24 family protein